MIPSTAVLRIARPTDQLEPLARMYIDGLGFERLGEFRDHAGFDGIIVGHPHQPYHLEFTHHGGSLAGRAPSEDHLLVFYLPGNATWQACCDRMLAAGFRPVPAFNPYWDEVGKTFEDIDGYRVVLQNSPPPV